MSTGGLLVVRAACAAVASLSFPHTPAVCWAAPLPTAFVGLLWAAWVALGGAARIRGVGGALSSEQKGLRSGTVALPATLGYDASSRTLSVATWLPAAGLLLKTTSGAVSSCS